MASREFEVINGRRRREAQHVEPRFDSLACVAVLDDLKKEGGWDDPSSVDSSTEGLPRNVVELDDGVGSLVFIWQVQLIARIIMFDVCTSFM